MLFWQLFIAVLCLIATTKGQEVTDNVLHNPDDPLKCLNRPKHWKWSPNNQGEQHSYFFSNDVPEFKDLTYDWLTARNLCRNHCMDAIAIETEAENNMLSDFIRNHDIYNHVGATWYGNGRCGSPFNDGTTSQCDAISDYPCCGRDGFCVRKDNRLCNCPECIDYSRSIDYLWTSGRLCDFTGCENRQDLLPINIRGWFWANNYKPIPDTDRAPSGWSDTPWSPTGHLNIAQPDNAEYGINQTPESCLGVLDNLYNDGVSWHDIACYHRKPVMCEDDDDLLRYMQENYSEYNFY